MPPTLRDQGVLKFQSSKALNLAIDRSVPFYNDENVTVFIQTILNDDTAIEPAVQIDTHGQVIFGTTEKN